MLFDISAAYQEGSGNPAALMSKFGESLGLADIA